MAKKNLITLKYKFITFEGPEGSGKSTQAKLLYRYLKRKGYKVIFLREPGGTEIGERIRRKLLSPNSKLEAIEETLLYSISRKMLLDKMIVPNIKKSRIIICDRFSDSTFAYQGWGLGVNLKFIKRIEELVLNNIKPDLTILLDLPIEKGLKRCLGSKDRIEQRSLKYHQRVRKGYLFLAKKYPKRIKIICAVLSRKAIQDKIREYVFCQN